MKRLDISSAIAIVHSRAWRRPPGRWAFTKCSRRRIPRGKTPTRSAYRFGSARVPRSCHGVRRHGIATAPASLLHVLPRITDPPVAEQRRAVCASRRFVQRRAGRRDSAGRRASSSVRTARCLIQPPPNRRASSTHRHATMPSVITLANPAFDCPRHRTTQPPSLSSPKSKCVFQTTRLDSKPRDRVLGRHSSSSG